MTFLKKIQIIERLDGLIRRKATGSADELARRIGMSRRSIYNVLNVMKSMGASIVYDNHRKSFVYEKDCKLSFGFVEKNKITGGNSQFNQICFPSAVIMHNLDLTCEDNVVGNDFRTLQF